MEFVDPLEGIGVIAAYRKIPLIGLGVVSVYPSSQLSTAMARTGFGVLVIFGVTFTFAVTAAYVVGNLLADRLARLADLARSVGAGDLERRTELVSQDEIGVIGSSINTIAKHLGEQLARLEDLSQSLRLTIHDVGAALASALDPEEAIRLAMLS